MSFLGIHIPDLGVHIISSDEFDKLKASAQSFVSTEADKVVAALKATDIGSVATQAVKDATTRTNPDGTPMSGLEKLESVVADVAPLVLKYVTGGGINAVISDAEGIARSLAQSVYLDVQKSSAGGIVQALVGLLKL